MATAAISSPAPPTGAAAYIAPDIPDTLRASFGAWIKGDAQTEAAKAELHLYRHTRYFHGASLNNVPNLPLSQAWTALQLGTNLTASLPHRSNKVRPEERATIGTSLGPDGKVGMIRLVSLHREGEEPRHGGVGAWVSSWFGNSGSDKKTASASLASNEQEPTSLVGKSATTSCGHPRYVNTLEIGTPEVKPDETKIVVLHGYGAGSAFAFQNINSWASAIPNSRLFALDWLGMGRSSRPPFHIPNSVVKQGVEARVRAAESFFIDSLEEWRQKMQLEKMTIIGHSLGGYLSLAYALRFPERVEKLILISPAGIPDNPDKEAVSDGRAFQSKGNKVGTSGATQELRDSQAQIAPRTQAEREQTRESMRRVAASASSSSNNGEIVQGAEPKGPVDARLSPEEKAEEEEGPHNPPRIGARTRSVLTWLWEQNLSPFAIIRSSGFLAPMMVARYTSRRFSLLPDEDLRALHVYCHGIFTDKGSSEYCLAHILAPGAFARLPMVKRISPLTMPIHFIYGQFD
ncbi:hypothetical protein OC846_006754, partial [Tilletia horrida]